MKTSPYTYAVARIRVLENNLLNSNEVERMLGAKNATEAYRILNELDYSNHIGDIQKLESFQEILYSGLQDVKDLLVKISPDQKILNILWFYYDIHNLKTALKGTLAKKDWDTEISPLFIKLGIISGELLKTIFIDKEKAELPFPEKTVETIMNAIKNATQKAEKNEKPAQVVDFILDRTYFKIILEIAQSYKNEFIVSFVKQSIDISNISAFLRVKLKERKKELLTSSLVKGGTIEVIELEKMFEEELPSIIEKLSFGPYEKVFKNFFNDKKSETSFLNIEKLLDNHRINFVKQSKSIPFGPEPLIAYFWAKKNNAQIVRTIMVGKLNGLSPDQIRNNLRDLFV